MAYPPILGGSFSHLSKIFAFYTHTVYRFVHQTFHLSNLEYFTKLFLPLKVIRKHIIKEHLCKYYAYALFASLLELSAFSTVFNTARFHMEMLKKFYFVS